MQEVIDATLVKKVETSIERNKSLQMLDIVIEHVSVEEAILKGARGNTSLKKLTLLCSSNSHQMDLKAAAAVLRQVRPQLQLHCYYSM